MAIRFRPLPLDAFPEATRPHIAQLNSVLGELVRLEGTIRNPLQTRRSDNTIVRRSVEQVHVTRITPDISSVVSGISSVTGTPAITYGTASAAGTTSTVIPINATLRFPQALMPLSGTTDTLTFTSGSSFNLSVTGTSDFFIIAAGAVSARANSATRVFRADLVPANNNAIGIVSDLEDGDLQTDTLSMVAANASLWIGGMTTSNIYGFNNPTWTFSPSSGSADDNVIYGARIQGPQIFNNNAGFDDLSGIYVVAPRRNVTNLTRVARSTGITVECPTVGTTTQIGLYINQRTAQQSAQTRTGLQIDAQNSGVMRRGAFIGDWVEIENPSGQTNNVLQLDQLNTGGTSGSHIFFSDKAGDVSGATTGDLWRNGNGLVFMAGASMCLVNQLMPITGGVDAMTLTESASNMTLEFGNTGGVTINSDNGFSMNASNAPGVLQVNIVVGNTNLNGIRSIVTGAGITGDTLSMWDASMQALTGVLDSATIYGFVNTNFSVSPSAGTTASKVYAAGFQGPLFNNSTGQWTEAAGIYVYGPRRAVLNPTVFLAAGAIIECPTVSGTTQIGVYIKQRGTTQAAPTNRYGLLIDAQMSGTNRWSIYGISDRAQFTGPMTVDGALGVTGSIAFSGTSTGNLTQAASLATGSGTFFGVSGTLGAGTSISHITPADQGRMIYLWAAQGTMGFSVSNTLRVIGNSINVPVNGAVQAFCTGTTWFVFSPSS